MISNSNTIISLADISETLSRVNEERELINITLLIIAGRLKISNCAAFYFKDKEIISKYFKGKYLKITNYPFLGVEKLIKLDKTDPLHSFYIEMGYKYAMPLLNKNNHFLLCCLGEKASKQEINLEEANYLSILSLVTSNNIQILHYKKILEKENEAIEERNYLLHFLFETSQDFSGILQQDEILRRISLHLLGQFAVNNFAFYIQASDHTYLLLKEVNLKGIVKNIDISKLGFENYNYIKIKDIKEVDDIKKLLNNDNAEYIVKLAQNKGVLVIGKRKSKIFSEQDINTIISIGNFALMAMENRRLIDEEHKKNQLETELKTTLEIQKALLPKCNPDIKNYSLLGQTEPAKIVGGDYYDFIKIDINKYLIVIADVSGKDIGAALIMANLQSALKTLLLFFTDLKYDLNQIITYLNSIIYENTKDDIYITLFAGILDIEENTFTYINAGHNPPIFISSQNEIKLLSAGGIILGFINPIPFAYNQETIKIEPKDTLFLYTDGIIEAKNRDGNMFGEENLINLLSSKIDLSAKELMDYVKTTIKDYQFERSDDITLIVLRRNM